VTAVIVVGMSCGSGESDGARRFLSLGTAGTGGIYYPLGGAIASRLSVADTQHQYTAEVTGGSVENVNRVISGEMDIGFSMATTVYEAFHGGRDFAEPLGDLRIVAPLYPNVTHVLVSRRSDAQSVADLTGRRVSVGSPGSGTEQLASQVLEAYGIDYADIDVRYLSFRESANALRDGAIDAALISVGYPAAAVLEATTTGDARLLPIDSSTRELLAERYPYYLPGIIPAGAYPGVDSEIPTVAVMNWMVGTVELEASVVRHLLNVLKDQREQLIQVSAIASQIDLEALQRAPIPLHPEAVSWVEEQTR
jgi:TRAP transporter TAXI family solute receptor